MSVSFEGFQKLLGQEVIFAPTPHVTPVRTIHRADLEKLRSRLTLVNLPIQMSHVRLKIHSNLLDCKHPLVAQFTSHRSTLSPRNAEAMMTPNDCVGAE